MKNSCLLGILLMLMAGCGGVNVSLSPKTATDRLPGLAEAAEAYYSAVTVQKMKVAVEKARAIDAQSAIYHELAADMAMLLLDKDERFNHLFDAVRSPDDEMAIVHLHQLYGLSWTLSQRKRVLALMETLALHHPKPAVATLAAHYLSLMLHRVGDLTAAQKWRDKVEGGLRFAIIGSWDNKQGKGFDLQYPPETELDFDATYPGQTVDISWRKDPVLGQMGEVDLQGQMTPSDSSVAYLTAAIDVKKSGDYELRLTTADGVRVWVNGVVVFSERQISNWYFDSIVIPLSLRKGVNRILIKSTHEDDGGWDMLARLTGVGGVALAKSDVTMVDPTTRAGASDAGLVATSSEQIVGAWLSSLSASRARAMFWAIGLSDMIGNDALRAQAAEKMSASYPDSVRARIKLAFALWDNQERGRTTELLSALYNDFGQELPYLVTKQIRFWRQNDLERKARDAAIKLGKQYPNNPVVQMSLADAYEEEGWIEDQCMTIEKVVKIQPDWVAAKSALASCLGELGFSEKKRKIQEELFALYPYDYSLMNEMAQYALSAFDFDKAAAILERVVDAWPERSAPMYHLAQIYRQQGKDGAARALFERIRQLNPDSSVYYMMTGTMDYLSGQKDKAVRLWKEGLVRNPDNGQLAERLDFLAPAKKDPFEVDIPTLDEIERKVVDAGKVKYHRAADVAMVIDHCVTDLKSDGSSINVTTTAMRALNTSGRDKITEFRVPCYGYSRVLHAFAVAPDGTHAEASSIRNDVIRFRQVEVGSTIVVQNRCEEPADSLIGDYYSYKWSFQSFSKQFLDSRFILYTPPQTKINEFMRGEIERIESPLDNGGVRYEWRAANTPVLQGEVAMPSGNDIAWRVQVSTVPDWGLFLKWENALLQDAFRESPEVKALAARLAVDKKTPMEKLLSIQAYLAGSIRYQQDYENMVAGVKPHTAPQVISRGYGDCKDKSVLFITLAKLMGIEAHFALVRTRNYGQIVQEVPSQQFNHAIVYVPAQDGVPEGVFFDATADALDVGVLRSDDPGTSALIFDFEAKTFEWIPIPYQAPSQNSGAETLDVTLSSDGHVSGTIAFEFKGHLASIFRRTARNPEKFDKMIQVVVDAIIKGASATLDEQKRVLDNIEQPVVFTVNIDADAFARVQKKEMRFRIPFDARPQKLFTLNKRQYPLVFGVPNKSVWNMTFALPAGAKVTHLPAAFEIDTPCLKYSRVVKGKRKVVTVTQELTYTCERISQEDYPTYRAEIQKLRSAIEEDVAVRLAK